MKEYKCSKCENVFEGEGVVKEYIDLTYGPCKRTFSTCPNCGYDECLPHNPSKTIALIGPSFRRGRFGHGCKLSNDQIT